MNVEIVYIYIYIVLRSRLSCLEEKHDRFKHHTRDEFIEINKTFCDIKDVLSKKSIEEDLKSITDNMDLLFTMIKEMERKYAGKDFIVLAWISPCMWSFLGASIFRFSI